mmetsp:Transcript_25476/g.39930  ORF Transcript_25476/g.39930 Transcript_25476/m.39930 type:complete len:187 (-) Transcript_25476:355-915(-)
MFLTCTPSEPSLIQPFRIFFDGVSHEEHEASLSKRELGFIIDNARKLNPEFTERAQSLIFAFLKCTRRVLSHGPVSFPYQADSLVRIAKAVASLRLSALVDLADVTIAIAVYEESRAAKLLPTLLQFENFPNGRSNLELYSDNLPGAGRKLLEGIVKVCNSHGMLSWDPEDPWLTSSDCQEETDVN